MLRSIVPEILHFLPPFRQAWAQGAKEYAHIEARRIPNCKGDDFALMQTPEPKHMGNSTSPKKTMKEVKRALGAMKALNICATGDSTTTGRPKYFQSLNLRRFHDGILTWSQSKRIAQAAADLLGVEHVRLYQGGFCRKGDAEGSTISVLNAGTNIHRDSDMTPVGGQHYITAWCPLRPIDPEVDSTLIFWDGSHDYTYGTDEQDAALKSIASDPSVRTYDQNLEDKVVKSQVILSAYADRRDESAVVAFAARTNDVTAFDDFGLNNLTLPEVISMKKELTKGRQRKLRVTEEEAKTRQSVCRHWTPGTGHMDAWSPFITGPQMAGVCDLATPSSMVRHIFPEGSSGEALMQEMWQADTLKSKTSWQGARTFGRLDLGDCTFHHGETMHAAAAPPQRDWKAGATTKDAPPRPVREAVTLTYMGAESRKIPLEAFKKMSNVKEIKDQEDYASYSRWYGDVESGAVIDHEECPQIV